LGAYGAGADAIGVSGDGCGVTPGSPHSVSFGLRSQGVPHRLEATMRGGASRNIRPPIVDTLNPSFAQRFVDCSQAWHIARPVCLARGSRVRASAGDDGVWTVRQFVSAEC
jgi:hypothetical protein